MTKAFKTLTLLIIIISLSSCFLQKKAAAPVVEEPPFEVKIDSNDSWMCKNVAFVLQDYPEYNRLRGKRVFVDGEYSFIPPMDIYNEYTFTNLTYADDTTKYYSKYVFHFQYTYAKKKWQAEKKFNSILSTLKGCSSFEVDTIIPADTVQANGSPLYQSYVKFKGNNAPRITVQRYYNRIWARNEVQWHVD
jgi:hypothetical protein